MGRKKAIKFGPNKPVGSSGKRITPIPVHPTSPGILKDFEEANANSPSSRTLGEEDTDDATSIGASQAEELKQTETTAPWINLFEDNRAAIVNTKLVSGDKKGQSAGKISKQADFGKGNSQQICDQQLGQHSQQVDGPFIEVINWKKGTSKG
ncbi:Hypothetical predicted protein [Olea europaea subsp. europaea]|uniref:Uncharacterized protein n=1 Tax=Olea europaea subsp. europaea TaxID=158383 RepID=A0A8S0QDS9_OLEEU|nr:Hypothetical predicted protein [Olea europaea subsp. europaea]